MSEEQKESTEGSLDSLVAGPEPVIEEPVVKKDEPSKEEEAVKKPVAIIDPGFSKPMATPGIPMYGYSFPMPSVVYPKMVKIVESLDETKLDDNDEKTKEWKEVVNGGTDPYTPRGMYTDNFYREGSLYEPGVADGIGGLNTLSKVETTEIRGDISAAKAILAVSRKLGLGDFIKVPLVHSGMWVHIQPAVERDLVDFYAALSREKINLGRRTSGFTLSNFSVYTNQALLDFIISHINSTSIIGLKNDKLKQHIYPQDYAILVWGFASAIYPNGFDYRRACLSGPETCKHIEEANISLGKLYECDNTALSEYQKQHMASTRAYSRSIDQMVKYKEEHTRIKKSYFKTESGIKINLYTPTIDVHFEQGIKWVNDIVEAIEKMVIGDDDKGTKEKDRLYGQRVRASMVRQYSHFIESIEVDEVRIDKPEALREAMDVMSGDDSTRVQVINEVNKYIADTTFALIGIPAYNCPVCKKPQNPEPLNERFTEVIPIDVVDVFFELLILRITRLQERAL